MKLSFKIIPLADVMLLSGNSENDVIPLSSAVSDSLMIDFSLTESRNLEPFPAFFARLPAMPVDY